MLVHVAMFRWKPGTAEAEVDALSQGLAGLPAAIPEIRSYRFGRDAGLRDGNDDYVVVAEFDDAAAFRRYADHPAHRDVIVNLLQPIADSRHAVQLLTD
jgi:heme-degrading monooxygenase HmoA